MHKKLRHNILNHDLWLMIREKINKSPNFTKDWMIYTYFLCV